MSLFLTKEQLFLTVPCRCQMENTFKKLPGKSSFHGVKNNQQNTRTAPHRIESTRPKIDTAELSARASFSSFRRCRRCYFVLPLSYLFSRSLSLSRLLSRSSTQAAICFFYLDVFLAAKFSRTRQPRKVGCFSRRVFPPHFFLFAY